MPLYDYACTACAHEFEEMNSEGQPAPVCPSCGSKDTQRRLSAPGIKRNAAPFKVGPRLPMAPTRGGGPCGGCGCSA